MFHHQRLRCYEMSIEVARCVPGTIGGWPRGHSPLEDQLKRAVASVALNIVEGNERTGEKERARFFSIAR
jgi:four helix bundle protein